MNIIANLPEESDVFQLLDQQTRTESAESFISDGSERTRSKSAQIVEEVIQMGAMIVQSENQTDSVNVKEMSSSRSNATVSDEIEEVSRPTSQIVNESCEVKSVETSKTSQKSRNNDTVNETADSLTRRVRDVLTMPPPGSKFSTSAMDSIEVKSVSSTTSSKFGFENKQFESTDLWRFVKQFIPADQEEAVKHKMMSEMSNTSIHSKATSNNSMPPTLTLSQLQTRNASGVQNKSGKSVVSEQRFVGGLVYSPVGSHKSSTPDHSLISGWKYTRDSDFITGNIKVAESESDQAKSTSNSSQSYSKSSQMSAISTSSGASASADELSQRVRNLLKEIDTSLDESEPKMTPKLPKLILDIEQTQDAFRREIRRTQSTKFGGHQVADKSSSQERSFSNRSIATPRSIEDLTTDEKYGSFMPASSHLTSHSPNYETCLQDVEDVELEEGELEDSTQEDEDLETYQTTVESQKKIIDVVESVDIRDALEKEQRDISRRTGSPSTTQQTETISEPLKSEDAEAPSFPSEVYGSRVEDETLNKTPSSLYQKNDKTRNQKTCRSQIDKSTIKLSPVPSCAPSVRIAEVEDSVDSIKVTEFVTPKNVSIHKSVVVKDVETTLEQSNDYVKEQSTAGNDETHNETASSVGSFYCPWFPKNMKEFKKLSRDQKREFVRILKKAAKKKHELSGISDVSSMSSASSIDLDVVFSKYPKQKMQEMTQHDKRSAHQSSLSAKDRSYEQPNEEKMTKKIIEAIKVDVQKTIKEEIKKIYPNPPTSVKTTIDQPRLIHSSIGVGQTKNTNSPRIVKAASEITHTLDSSANKGN